MLECGLWRVNLVILNVFCKVCWFFRSPDFPLYFLVYSVRKGYFLLFESTQDFQIEVEVTFHTDTEDLKELPLFNAGIIIQNKKWKDFRVEELLAMCNELFQG